MTIPEENAAIEWIVKTVGTCAVILGFCFFWLMFSAPRDYAGHLCDGASPLDSLLVWLSGNHEAGCAHYTQPIIIKEGRR